MCVIEGEGECQEKCESCCAMGDSCEYGGEDAFEH